MPTLPRFLLALRWQATTRRGFAGLTIPPPSIQSSPSMSRIAFLRIHCRPLNLFADLLNG